MFHSRNRPDPTPLAPAARRPESIKPGPRTVVLTLPIFAFIYGRRGGLAPMVATSDFVAADQLEPASSLPR